MWAAFGLRSTLLIAVRYGCEACTIDSFRSSTCGTRSTRSRSWTSPLRLDYGESVPVEDIDDSVFESIMRMIIGDHE